MGTERSGVAAVLLTTYRAIVAAFTRVAGCPGHKKAGTRITAWITEGTLLQYMHTATAANTRIPDMVVYATHTAMTTHYLTAIGKHFFTIVYFITS